MDSNKKEVIRFNDLSPYLLLKNGNYLYKIPFRDGFAVLKVYYEDSGQRTGEQPDLIHAHSSLANRIRVPGSLAREILAYLKSLGKTIGEAHWDHFMKVTVEEYPDRNLIEHTYTFAFRNPNLLVRAARMLDRKIKPRAAKPFSKYNTAQKLHLLLTS